MKQFFYLAAICMLALSACKNSFKKGDMGLEYKIISSGSGKTIGYGNFMQIHSKEIYGGTKDTVLHDTRSNMPFMPQISLLDSVSTPLAYYKIFSQLKRGDSVIVRLLSDSVYKNSQQGMPPFVKKGKYMYLHIKMVNFFETREQADSAHKAELAMARPRITKKQMEEIEKQLATKKTQIEAEGKVIEAYLAKNNIKATKTKWGTYISIINEGTGEKSSITNIATVNYTGRTLDSGRVFDSNVDPKFGHAQPYDVNISAFDVVLGWSDALMNLKKGSKAVIYIPSSLGYGETGKGEIIKPGDNLIFDMEVLDITTEEQFAAKQKAMQEEMMRKMQQQQNEVGIDTVKKGR